MSNTVKYYDQWGNRREILLDSFDENFGAFKEIRGVQLVTIDIIIDLSELPENYELKDALVNYFPELLL